MDTRKRRKDMCPSQSYILENLHSLPKRAKVHAQRKFAQGSQPSSPALTPVKELRDLRERTPLTECQSRLGYVLPVGNASVQSPSKAQTSLNQHIRPKTEDFLTFLCFRRTSMLLPELEFFETPQLLENCPNGTESRGMSPPKDERSSKMGFRKKEDLLLEEKLLPMSTRRGSDTLDLDSCATPRVTRSSASLTPTPSFLSSQRPSVNSGHERSLKGNLSRKQILLKKAMLIKAKSFKDRRRRVRIHLRSQAEKRMCALTRKNASKPFNTLPLNVCTRNNSRKAATLLSLRKKEGISRLLKRLGPTSTMTPSSTDGGRVTRSRNEAQRPSRSVATTKKSGEMSEEVPVTSVVTERRTSEESRDREKQEAEEKLFTPMSGTSVIECSGTNIPKRNVDTRKRVSRTVFPKERHVTKDSPPEGSSRARCTRSASDSASRATGLDSQHKNDLPLPERSHSCEERDGHPGRRVLKDRSGVSRSASSHDPLSKHSLRQRPSRKTKKVAEVYLELMSQRLAKESHKGKSMSDEDLEEDDAVSISSIKELKSLSKSGKMRDVDIEKCMQEIAEKHFVTGKGSQRHSPSEKMSSAKTQFGRSSAREVCNEVLPEVKVKREVACEPQKRDLRSSSSVVEGNKNKQQTAVGLHGRRAIASPKRTDFERSTEDCTAKNLRGRTEVPSSPRGSKNLRRLSPATASDGKSTTRRASPASPKSPSPSKLAASAPDKSSGARAVKTLRKRAFSETSEPSKGPIVRRLSYDAKHERVRSEKKSEKDGLCKKLKEIESVNVSKKVSVIEKKSLQLRTRRSETSDEKKNTNKLTRPSSLPCKGSLPDNHEPFKPLDTSSEDVELFKSKDKIPEQRDQDCEKVKLVKEEIIPDISGEASKGAENESIFSSSVSSRAKRTLSLDSDQRSSINFSLKRKFGSMESVSAAASTSAKANTPEQKSQKEPATEITGASLQRGKKSSCSRRRSGIHDEDKLNAVLESVAKDFEKEMDDKLFHEIEKDLNSGNKSPDKGSCSLLKSLRAKEDTQLEERDDSVESASRAASSTLPKSSSPSPINFRKNSTGGKKLCDVVRNLQERKQAQSPLNADISDTPLFVQDLQSLDSRNFEKQKQVSEEAVVTQPFDLAPAPTPSKSHSTVSPGQLSLVPSAHPCMSQQKALDNAALKDSVCIPNKSETTLISRSSSFPENKAEVYVPLSVPSVTSSVAIERASSTLSDVSITSTNVCSTTYIPFPSTLVNVPVTNVSSTMNAKLLSTLRTQTHINVACGPLPTKVFSPRIAPFGSSITLANSQIAQTAVLSDSIKSIKGDYPLPKANSKQILIAPKPSKLTPSSNASSSLGVMSPLKNIPKPVQIAPKFPMNSSVSSSVGNLQTPAPILPASQMGHVIQGVPHQMQTVQRLPQGLQTVQTISQGLQPIPVQAITQNFPSIDGVTPAAVQAVITQTVAINRSQLVTPSSPAKILTQPVFVTSSMPNVVGAPFDLAMPNPLQPNVGTVARVVAQNVVGKVPPKVQASLVPSGAQSLVTLAPGAIETSVMPSIVPFHQPLQPGHSAQFVTVNMMPVAASQIPLQGARHISSSQIGPILCPQTIGCMPSTQAVPCSIAPMSAPLKIIPPGSIVTCPLPVAEVNSGSCSAAQSQPFHCLPTTTQSKVYISSAPDTVSSVAGATDTPSLNVTKIHSEDNEERSLTSSSSIPISESAASAVEGNASSASKQVAAISIPYLRHENLNIVSVPSERMQVGKENKVIEGEDTTSSNENLSRLAPEAIRKVSTEVVSKSSDSQTELASNLSNSMSQDSKKSLPVLPETSDHVSGNITTFASFHSTNRNITQVSVTPNNHRSSHTVLSNLGVIFTTTSIVIPKMPDHSMTSPKAVTKVSQSSPPYVLSTSTSNDKAVKPVGNAISETPNTSKSHLQIPNYLDSMHFPSKNTSACSQPVRSSGRIEDAHDVPASVNKNTSLSSTDIHVATPSVTQSIKTSTNVSSFQQSKSDNNLSSLEPKIFYSKNNSQTYVRENDKKDLSSVSTAEKKEPSATQSLSVTSNVTISTVPSTQSFSKKSCTDDVKNATTKSGKQQGIGNKVSSVPAKLYKKQLPVPKKFKDNGKAEAKQLCFNSNTEKKPIIKKTLFKTKNTCETKPSDAFSPLNENSVYAFEPDVEPPLEVTSKFSQRFRSILPSSGPSPTKASSNACKVSNEEIKESVKDGQVQARQAETLPLRKNDAAKNIPPKVSKCPLPSASLPLPKVTSAMSVQCLPKSAMSDTSIPATEGLHTPVLTPTPREVLSSHNNKPVSKSPGNSPLPSRSSHGGSDRSDISNFVKSDNTEPKEREKLLDAKIQKEILTEIDSESNDSDDLEIEAINVCEPLNKCATSSTSIAIQCDLDDSLSEKSQDELKGSESGTQTEGAGKFPLLPSVSPFYYLPLAMATLGEKLPAQLVQQMLAKTKGLVGTAEAGLILQQAAQLAQQYRKTSEEGEPSISPSPAVKPISPKSYSAALQKALKANSASIAQAESYVAQSTGMQMLQVSTRAPTCKEVKETRGSTDPYLKFSSGSESPSNLLKVASPPPPAKDDENSSVSTCVQNKKAKSSEKVKNVTPAMQIVNEASDELENEAPNVEEKAPAPTKKSGISSKGKCGRKMDAVVKRRSGRATTLAATKATESDLQEVEELKRNRRAKRAAAVLAKEEGWSSSSDAPLSPLLSSDMLRGWPPPRLTSPSPSQSSEGTTASSSTVSQRSRVSAPQSRRQSPASSADSTKRAGRYSSGSSVPPFTTDPVISPGPLRIADNPKLCRAPSFFPSEEEFTDPLDYIEKIRPEAEQFGLCRIVPPGNFRPECRVNDDMRFTAYKQYIHRMMRRWGPNDRTLAAIKKCLAKQHIELTSNPVIGGLELDLVNLYEVVEDHGGLMKVIEKELWLKVADALRIPKSAQDRISKLDAIYCKYLLPYTMLSAAERAQLLSEVEACHARQSSDTSKRTLSTESSDADDDDNDEALECIVKDKSTALSSFYRVARNIAGQWQPDPAGLQFDERFWSVVREGHHHICVLAASIDTSEHGYGFPNQKSSPKAKHPWNLKNLCQNPNSVLRSMGKVIGVTAPTLHVGMMFSAVCWYRDPHSLPWIEYLHTGASKIWYGVSANNEEKFHAALKKLVPDFIKDSPLWLPSDTAMVCPDDLVREDVKVSRVVQEPGQFVVVFPGAFTSSVCSGYLISESAFFARPQYFDRAISCFSTLSSCCEPSMFCLDRLALSVASDPRATLESLVRARRVVASVIERETSDRKALTDLGLTTTERMSTPSVYRKRKSRYSEEDEENCCEVCRQYLYISMVTLSQEEETVFCLQHTISLLSSRKDQLRFCKLLYTYSMPELTSILKQMDDRIQSKSCKWSPASSQRRTKVQDTDSWSGTSESNA